MLAQNSADVLRYADRRIGTEDAADALAEVMLTAWRRIDSLPHEHEQARMWLFGIARNVIANATRSEHRRGRLAQRLRGALASGIMHGNPADHGLEVRDAIARLPDEQAELVRLVHWEGFSIADAGAILGIPASTARTRYQRARADLKEALSRERNGVA
ncbi:RNA polymerase sigma factor [Microbacterium sp. GXF6406]